MSRADRFDRGDFEVRYGKFSEAGAHASRKPGKPRGTSGSATTPHQGDSRRHIEWPVARLQIKRVGDATTNDRDGTGRPHKGLDIFADAGTEVLAAKDGTVLRVIDGRRGETSSQRRAGLFVDVRGKDDLIYRYLHLHVANVQKGEAVSQGAVLGVIAPPFTSGLAEESHLHFEVRQHDYQRTRKDYGPPIDPRRLLPALRS